MKKKVVVGMSGGVDSSVAAFLLKQQGYDVIGVTMQIWQDEEETAQQENGGCCGLSAVDDARRVAWQLEIPYYVMNFKKEFKCHVMDYFVDEYLRGRTPNPCIACNRCGMNGQCIFNDDFGQLRPHLVTADMVVFATPMYYFGFSSQLKAVIDRFYALNGQVKGSEKRSALLMAYADTAAEEAEPMLSHYHTLLRYLGWKDCGTVVAEGMWPTGAVNDTEYSRQAYELGRKCFG